MPLFKMRLLQSITIQTKKCHHTVAFTHGVISTYRNPFTFYLFFYFVLLTKNMAPKVAFSALCSNSKR